MGNKVEKYGNERERRKYLPDIFDLCTLPLVSTREHNIFYSSLTIIFRLYR